MRRSSRLLEIDALRGIAAILVVAYHYTAGYKYTFGWPGTQPLILFGSAQIGVAIFFVISGFVISMTLERSDSALDFIVSRFARLYPAFWSCAFLTTFLIALTGFNPFGLTNLGFLSTITMANGVFDLPYVDPSYWTLTRELLFYILLGGVYFTIGKRHVTIAMMMWIILSAAYNVSWADGRLCETASGCVSLSLNTDFAYLFASGVIIYKIFSGDRSPIVWLTLLAAIASGSVADWPEHHLLLLVPLKTALYVGLTAAAANGYLPVLKNQVLLFFGIISYSLYLIHQVFGYYVIQYFSQLNLGANFAIILAFASVVTLAAIVCYMVERPCQRFIRQWYDRRKIF